MGLSRDRIVVVTGASRGAGKGIAIALGATGATVYVTGRTRNEGDAALPGTVQATADAVTAAGGKGIAVYCDHGDDAQVQQLFERVRNEQGRLDILVNNATSLHDDLTRSGPFWEKSLALTSIWEVGMRSHYTAAWHAAPLLLANGEGLIVNTSSFGGRIYMHGPAYGAGKAVIDALACDAQRMAKSGKVLIGAELGQEYGITDASGSTPISHRAFFGDPTSYGDAVVE